MLQGVHLLKYRGVAAQRGRRVKTACASAAGFHDGGHGERNPCRGKRGQNRWQPVRAAAGEYCVSGSAGNKGGRTPPTSIWLRLNIRCCGVMVAASSSLPSRTYSAASLVVMCSKYHLQAGQALTQRLHDRFNKARSRSKNIDISMGDLTVNQQRHPQLFHAFQHRHNGIRTGDAVAGVGCSVGRIELGGVNTPSLNPRSSSAGSSVSVR